MVQRRITARMYIGTPSGCLGLRGAAARRSATWPPCSATIRIPGRRQLDFPIPAGDVIGQDAPRGGILGGQRQPSEEASGTYGKDDRLAVNAAKVGMDAKTARKYLREDGLPSELAATHTWRTREDPFVGVWSEVNPFLELNPGLEAKTLFEYLQRIHPGRFPDGQLRSFQRGVRRWRALEGPPKEVFFAQEHQPGYLCQSDFTYMHDIGVTIGGEVFDHLLYHFVLTYSNWESGTVCFSESFESLSEGLQDALWELGAVPTVHQTDRMTAAVSPSRTGGVHATLRGAAEALRAGRPLVSGAAAARERRCGAASPPLQASGRPGADAARVAGLRHPR